MSLDLKSFNTYISISRLSSLRRYLLRERILSNPTLFSLSVKLLVFEVRYFGRTPRFFLNLGITRYENNLSIYNYFCHRLYRTTSNRSVRMSNYRDTLSQDRFRVYYLDRLGRFWVTRKSREDP